MLNASLYADLYDDIELCKLFTDEHQLRCMLQVEAACTRGYGKHLEDDRAESLAQFIEEAHLDLDALRQDAARDGVVVPGLIRQLRQQAGSQFGDEALDALLHPGLTSQDIIDTALMMTLEQANTLLSRRLEVLCEALDALNLHSGNNPLNAYTRMQRAALVTVSDRVKLWREPLRDMSQSFESVRDRLRVLQLGGPVGVFDDARLTHEIARILKLSSEPCWHTDRSRLADYGHWLSKLTGLLGKMGQDITLMAQIGELELASGGSSSAMPHKQNPVKAEALVTLARYNATLLSNLHHALVHEQERSGSAWALEWLTLPDMVRRTGASVRVAVELSQDIRTIGAGRAERSGSPH